MKKLIIDFCSDSGGSADDSIIQERMEAVGFFPGEDNRVRCRISIEDI